MRKSGRGLFTFARDARELRICEEEFSRKGAKKTQRRKGGSNSSERSTAYWKSVIKLREGLLMREPRLEWSLRNNGPRENHDSWYSHTRASEGLHFGAATCRGWRIWVWTT